MERRISHSATTLALNNPESIANMEIHHKIKMTTSEQMGIQEGIDGPTDIGCDQATTQHSFFFKTPQHFKKDSDGTEVCVQATQQSMNEIPQYRNFMTSVSTQNL